MVGMTLRYLQSSVKSLEAPIAFPKVQQSIFQVIVEVSGELIQ